MAFPFVAERKINKINSFVSLPWVFREDAGDYNSNERVWDEELSCPVLTDCTSALLKVMQQQQPFFLSLSPSLSLSFSLFFSRSLSLSQHNALVLPGRASKAVTFASAPRCARPGTTLTSLPPSFVHSRNAIGPFTPVHLCSSVRARGTAEWTVRFFLLLLFSL